MFLDFTFVVRIFCYSFCMRIISFLILVSILFSFSGCTENPKSSLPSDSGDSQIATHLAEESQSPDPGQDYRDRNWHPENGQYHFTEEWIYAYHDETKPESDPRGKGTFAFYLDPESGTLFLDKHISGFVDEMTDWIIIHPEGHFLMAYTDVHGEQSIIQKDLQDVPNYTELQQYQAEEFARYCKPNGQKTTFGANKYYNKTIPAQGYEMTFAKTSDISSLFLAQMEQPVLLYYVPLLWNELGLPINLNFGHILPPDQLIVQEEYLTPEGKKIGLKLDKIYATDYHIQVP